MLRVIILTLGLILLLGSSYILADEKPNISKIADQPKLSKKLPNETQLDKLRELGDDVKIEWNRENGTPLFLYGSLAKSTNGITAERASNNFLDEHKALFKLEIPEKDLKIHSLETDQIGYTHVKYDQYIDDVPIWGSQLGIHINPGREVYAVSGNYHPSIDMSTMPSIADSQAMTIAIKDFNINDPRQVDGRAKLVVFPWKDEYHLCWHIQQNVRRYILAIFYRCTFR
jgi:Zn-dependent metalloprotease